MNGAVTVTGTLAIAHDLARAVRMCTGLVAPAWITGRAYRARGPHGAALGLVIGTKGTGSWFRAPG